VFNRDGGNVQQTSTAVLFDSVPPDVLHLFKGSEPQPDRVLHFLNYKKADVAAASRVPLSSVRFDNKMPDKLRERLIEWAVALNRVGSFFKNEEKTLLWFQVSNPMLGNISPRDMIRAGRFKKLLKFIETALAENRS